MLLTMKNFSAGNWVKAIQSRNRSFVKGTGSVFKKIMNDLVGNNVDGVNT